MSSTGTINKMGLNSNSNLTLHKVHHYHHHQTMKHKNSGNSTCSTSSQDGSSSSQAIYVDEHEDPNTGEQQPLNSSSTIDINNNHEIIKSEHQSTHSLHAELQSLPQQIDINISSSSSKPRTYNLRNHHHQHHQHHHLQTNLTRNSLFGHDCQEYMPSFKLFQKLGSAQEYYSNLDISQLPIFNSKKHKDRRSDCPSEISSIDSRRRKKNKVSSIRRILSWMKYINSIICQIVRITFDFIILSCKKFQKWQKDIQEAPIEIKEKYFFVISTIISTILFYILFLCLDFMIKHWFALPHFITEYSFSISYCISYLTSVIWQHFLNQYFVFALKTTSITNNDNDNFCDSLIRTYLVYGTSLFITGIIGSILQIYAGMTDEFVLILTLPISGFINYYLLRYCHNKNTKNNKNNKNHHNHNININNGNKYQLIPTNDGPSINSHHHNSKTKKKYHSSKTRHLKHPKYSKSTSVISYTNKKYQHHHHHHHHHHTNHHQIKLLMILLLFKFIQILHLFPSSLYRILFYHIVPYHIHIFFDYHNCLI